MESLLRDLYGHQAWADAEHWRAFEALPAALEDAEIRSRLEHLFQAECAFLCLARGEDVSVKRLADFPNMAAMRDDMRLYHEQAAAFLDAVRDTRLAEIIVLPWFKEPPIRVTVAEALAQAAMHSHYHRAQNARRLRQMGGSVPTTDLIYWYWKGRPAPEWGGPRGFAP